MALLGCNEHKPPAASGSGHSNAASRTAESHTDETNTKQEIEIAGGAQTDAPIGISAPPGFQVTRYAGDDLAHNITSMTIDARGRVVVSGPSYVKTLHDDDTDGVADRAANFCEYPGSGAHGMLFLGNDLLCNGDGGLRLLRDADGDGRWDGRTTREEWMKVTHTEHGAGGIVHGPDGNIYMICGNDAGVSPQHVSGETSPVVDSVGGTLLRISPDGSETQIIAHGFRNPYDIAFTADASLITVDSDGERDQYLPWYSPTRMFDIALGQQHGWLLRGWQRSWNQPESFFDNVERLAELGRGSPTGLVVYRHTQFPDKYRNAALSACWTLGRVYHIPLEQETATYKRVEPEVFLQTTGSVGFAPVDLAVGPDGDLFVAIGGRGTQGGVFRVSYVGDTDTTDGPEHTTVGNADSSQQSASDRLAEVLDAPQPLASWSRARWTPVARELGSTAFADVATDDSQSIAHRRRAIEILLDVFDGLTADVAEEVIRNTEVEDIRAHIAWALGRSPAAEHAATEKQIATLLADLAGDESPLVARHAWESLLQRNPDVDDAALSSAWTIAARAPRRVRNAMLTYAAQTDSSNEAIAHLKAVAADDLYAQAAILRLEEPNDSIENAVELFAATDDAELRLTALRLVQLRLGNIELANNKVPSADGYVATGAESIPLEIRENAATALQAAFPSGDAEVDRELARTIALLHVLARDFIDKLAHKWTPESRVTDDLHYLMAAASILEAGEEATTSAGANSAMAGAFASLHFKLSEQRRFPSRNWPARVGELAARLLAKSPPLAEAIISDEAFGRVDHSLFVARMRREARVAGVLRLLETTLGNDPRFASGYEEWTPEMVALLRHLPPEESLPHLNAAWEEFALRDAVLPLLARSPTTQHQAKYLEALDSTQPRIVQQALDALLALSDATDPSTGQQELQDPDELSAILSALRQACLAPPQQALRSKLLVLLNGTSGQSFDITEDAIDPDEDLNAATASLLTLYAPCFAWFRQTYPEAIAAAGSPFTGAAWQERMDEIDWASGDITRGEAYYRRKTCHRCHDGAGGLGPELRGSAGRLSREDLFAAIVDPNRDVAPLYQTTLIETEDGQVYIGQIVYESPEGTLVQTSPDEVIRISDTEIRTQQRSRRSLMPQGLLDDATDQDLADLDAYLRSLVVEEG